MLLRARERLFSFLQHCHLRWQDAWFTSAVRDLNFGLLGEVPEFCRRRSQPRSGPAQGYPFF